MAVIKVNYTKNRQKAKASLRYMVHRLGREAERLTRTLFAESGEVDKRAGYELIDKASAGSVFFRMIFSPHPTREDTYKDLPIQRIFENTVRQLALRLGKQIQYLAVLHDDHSDIRHIHSILVLRGRITRDDIKALRAFATDSALLERRARDVVVTGRFALYPKPRQPRFKVATLPNITPANWHSRRLSAYGTTYTKTRPCPQCLFENEKWRNTCKSCGYERERERGASFSL